MSVLTRYVSLGHKNADPPRVKTIKSILVVVVVVIGLLNLQATISAYVEGQTLNVFVQGYLVGVSLLPLALLAMGRGIASVVNWTFLAWLPNIVFVLLIYGNRGNEAVYLLLIPLGAVFVFGLDATSASSIQNTCREVPHRCSWISTARSRTPSKTFAPAPTTFATPTLWNPCPLMQCAPWWAMARGPCCGAR